MKAKMETRTTQLMPDQANRVRFAAILAAIIWVVLVFASFLLAWRAVERNAVELALTEAKSSYNKDLLYRRWASVHGGVYVPVSPQTPSNPYLDVPNRDVTTTAGQSLTLVNPAYMTRQVHAMSLEQYGVRGHIASLKPINPANTPDSWEESALRSFEAGSNELSSVEMIDGKPHLRFMQPMSTEVSCLKCHAKQGYKVGQVRGGISVAVPMEPYRTIMNKEARNAATTHAILGLLGLMGIHWGQGRFRKYLSRLAANERRFRLFYEHAPIAYQALNPEGRIIEVNDAWTEMLGYSKEEVLGRLFTDVLAVEQQEEFRSHCPALFSGDPAPSAEWTLRHKSGSIVIAVLVGRAGWQSLGNTECAQCVLHNVTQQRAAHEATRASESRYKGLFSHSLNAVSLHEIVTNDEGQPVDYRFLEVNAAFEIHTGLRGEQVTGRLVTEVIPGIRETGLIAAYGEVALQGRAARFEQHVPSMDRYYEIEAFSPQIRQFATVFNDITERKRAETELRKKTEELQVYFDSALDLLCIADTQGYFRKLNPEWERALGYPLQELEGRRFLDFVHPEDVEATREATSRLDNQGSVLNFTNRYRHEDGTYRWIEWRAYARGEMIVAVARDITQHRKVEADLRNSEERFRQLAENVQEVFWLGTPDWQQVLYINGTYEKVWGRSRESLYRNGRDWFDSVLEKDRPGILEGVKRLSSGDWNDPAFPVYRIARPDGQIRWIQARAYPVRDEEGRVVRVAGIAEDITLAREVNETLKRSEERFAKVFANAPVVITLSDLEDGAYVEVNQYFCKLTGFTREEALGRSSVALGWMKASDRSRLVETVRQKGRVENMELTLRAKDGRLVDCLYGGELVSIAGREGLLSIGVDITERKRLGEQLRQAQKMEAVGQLAGGVAHDFNNILAATMMNLSLLQRKSGLDAETKEALAELQSEAKRAANLTRQLLMFSRRSVLEIKILDLNDVVANLLRMLSRLIGEHIKLIFEAAPHLPPVAVDAGMMEQVLMNLSVNARDAMPKGGRLTIATEAVTIDATQGTSSPDRRLGRFVCLAVSDTGCGMDEATLRRVFEPFFTTKEAGKGTGLGLATVYGIAAQHKGWVEVTSQVGVGTSFRVYLPATESAIQQPAQTEDLALPGGTETILLVEDERTLRRSIAQGLRSLRYTVIEAHDGKEAMTLWKRHRSQIALLLTDMVMPEGITGLELAETLLKDRAGLKVLISSGYSAEMVEQGKPTNPGIRYLPKPFTPEALARLIRECLDQR